LLLFNDLLAMGLEKSPDRFKLHLKAPLRDCLLVDDFLLYSKLGSMPLHDANMKRPTNKLERSLMLANAPTKGGSTAGAWKLLQSNGLSMERVLESQVDERSFLIQAPNQKTLYLTAPDIEEKNTWINALGKAIIEQTSVSVRLILSILCFIMLNTTFPTLLFLQLQLYWVCTHEFSSICISISIY
jgi:hypothetical protein